MVFNNKKNFNKILVCAIQQIKVLEVNLFFFLI